MSRLSPSPALGFLLVFLVLPVLQARRCQGEELVFFPTDDALVRQDALTGNFGEDSRLVVGFLQIEPVVREIQSYLRFDLSSIPPGSTVLDATLTVFSFHHDPLESRSFFVDQITGGSWSEETITWANRPGCACQPVPSLQADPGLWEFPVASIVQSWVTDGAPNDGLRVGMDLTLSFGLAAFRSKEFKNSNIQPRLQVSFLRPEIACRQGTVNLGAGQVQPVLFLNDEIGDESRIIELSTDAALHLRLDAPPQDTSARFVLYAFGGVGDSSTLTTLPFGAGCLAFPIPGSGGGAVIHEVWNNLGFTTSLGAATRPSVPAPTTLFSLSRGTGRGVTVTFQGVILDSGSAGSQPASATNAIVLKTF